MHTGTKKPLPHEFFAVWKASRLDPIWQKGQDA
jgi:hypothetical protein